MDDIKFNSLNELYIRLLPAFNTKKNELLKKNILIREIDIWNYLKENKWCNSENLDIYEMVSDILEIDEVKFLRYLDRTKNESI